MQPVIVSYTPPGSDQEGIEKVLCNALILARECERVIGTSDRCLPPDHDTALGCPETLWGTAAEIECTLFRIIRELKGDPS